MISRLSLTAVMISLLSIVAQAEPPGHRGREALIDRLRLTEAQERQFSDLMLSHRKGMVRQRSEIRLAQIDLQYLMDADVPDRTAITVKMEEISDLQHQLKLLRVEHLFEVMDLLDPEQGSIWREHHRGRASGNHRRNPGIRSFHRLGNASGENDKEPFSGSW